MKTYTFEDQEYILKTDVDKIVRERLGKMSEKTRIADSRIIDLENQLEKQKNDIAKIDALNSQLVGLQDELNQAQSKYNQHSTIANHGIVESDVRDAILWSYERTMATKPKKDRLELSKWIEECKTNPQSAPANIRPFFNDQTTSTTSPAQTSTNDTAPAAAPPMSNNQVVNASDSITTRDLLSRAHDPKFYEANRPKIKEAFFKLKAGNKF